MKICSAFSAVLELLHDRQVYAETDRQTWYNY